MVINYLESMKLVQEKMENISECDWLYKGSSLFPKKNRRIQARVY